MSSIVTTYLDFNYEDERDQVLRTMSLDGINVDFNKIKPAPNELINKVYNTNRVEIAIMDLLTSNNPQTENAKRSVLKHWIRVQDENFDPSLMIVGFGTLPGWQKSFINQSTKDKSLAELPTALYNVIKTGYIDYLDFMNYNWGTTSNCYGTHLYRCGISFCTKDNNPFQLMLDVVRINKDIPMFIYGFDDCQKRAFQITSDGLGNVDCIDAIDGSDENIGIFKYHDDACGEIGEWKVINGDIVTEDEFLDSHMDVDHGKWKNLPDPDKYDTLPAKNSPNAFHLHI